MKKIIVVDDDEGLQDVLGRIFKKLGYETAIYANGESLLQDAIGRPDMILLDKQLSGIDGLEVCRHLKKQKDTKQTPVIMISANPNIDMLAREAGADDVLKKPFNLNELMGMVSKHA